jgi:hypothetical protein
VARYGIPWTEEAKWTQLVVVTNYTGKTWDKKFGAAQADIVNSGGGVYFPAGIYEFKETIRLESHVIIRGATPRGIRTARDGEFKPPARSEFPSRTFRSSTTSPTAPAFTFAASTTATS